MLGFSTTGLDGAQMTILNGLLRGAESRGWKVVTTNSQRNAQVQQRQIDYLIGLPVDAVVVVPDDSAAVCESVARARARGVRFYAIDRAPLGCATDLTVLADNAMAGRQAGEAMLRLLIERYHAPRGTVLEVQGDPKQNVSRLRSEGFHDAFRAAPKVQIVSRSTAWQQHEFAEAIQETLATTDIDGIFLHSDAVGMPVVLPILERMGRRRARGQPGHVFLTGVDGSDEALQAIRAGWADQASRQPLSDYGLIVDFIERDLRGEPVALGPVVREGADWSPAALEEFENGRRLLLSTTSVTATNVDRYLLRAER